MEVSCPSCGHGFHVEHPHLTNDGFVAVRLHRRKKRTLYVRREDADEDMIDDIERLRHENQILRRKVMSQKASSEHKGEDA